MHPLKRARSLVLWLLVTGVLACSCSGRDVSLGEDLHPTPAPTPTPTPIPVPTPEPTPTPSPTYPCETQRGGSCLAPSEHCDGRFTMASGYECGPNTVCCERAVGMGHGGSGGGGTSNMDPAASGAGGQ